MVRYSLLVPGLLAIGAACQPNTTRPSFLPVPEAAGTEVRLPVPQATQRLAEALKADSIPVRKVRIRDGYMETGWFATATRRPAAGARVLGPRVVRVRAWADPARPGSSQLTVETVYRPLRDPSLPDRELEREVAPDHPVALKVVAALQQLVQRYGGPPPEEEQPAAQPEESPPDEGPPDEGPPAQ
jgi:hypothetical protein